jgi:hypothetical protein
MSSKKIKQVLYLTAEDKDRLEQQAEAAGRNLSAYFAELVMWDSQLNLVERARRGELKEEKA